MLQTIPRRTRTSRRPFDEEIALRPSDIEYARDIFAELVTAIALKRPKSLRTSEIEMLAEQSLNMAKRFAAAQQQSIQTHRVALAQDESPIKPLPFGSSPTFAQVAQEWMERSVKRAAHTMSSLRSRFERFVLPHLGAKPVAEIEPQEILSVIRAIESAGHLHTANSTFRDIRSMYRYALAGGLSNHDPTAVLRRAINKPRSKGILSALAWKMKKRGSSFPPFWLFTCWQAIFPLRLERQTAKLKHPKT
jgi:hypothetical protein